MRPSNRNPLNRIARSITDGSPVNWESLRIEHPELASRLEKLRLIQNLAHSSRRPAPSPAGTSTADDSESDPDLPFLWGPLEVRSRIAEGSFGEVFRLFGTRL